MFYKFKIGLQFFAPEGAGGGAGQMSGAAAGAGASGATAGVAQPAFSEAGTATDKTADENGVATVPEGETAAEGEQSGESVRTPEQEFDGLIGKSGKFNRQFTQKVDEIMKKRFGQNEGMKAEIASLNGKVAEYEKGLAPLYQLYGVSDVSDLYDKISANSSFWDEEADKRGMTAQELQAQIKRDLEVAELKRENEQYKNAEAERVNQAKQRAQYEQWDKQVEELRKTVPDFDMRSEMENNRDFAKLIRAGIGIDMAYNMTHMEDQISRAREDGKKEAAAEIAQRKARPRENAAAYAGGASMAPRMPATAEERAKIAQRAARGETDIDFKTKF